ncbi:PREDICTED: cell surface glycoprotein CD200 receptor 1-like [Condylura cristata]|uniref:cell surface glycoprotein CD200 receptor 1-like n=1 Tax=Condylura cristata TaxID=143302 RepID=UPI000642A555|nr:PREDICTED: cell surface glycoprotein CD200 receptor 1-like [Condylura cristata]
MASVYKSEKKRGSKEKAETGKMWLQAKEQQDLLAASKSWKKQGSSLASERNTGLLTPSFQNPGFQKFLLLLSSSLKKINDSAQPTEVNRPLLALEGTKVVLCCPPVQGSLMMVIWTILLRDRLPCTRDYREDTKETHERNCSDLRITWISGRDQNPAVQIDPVSLTHDGNYTCELVTAEGNFRYGYHLQVSVPPKVSLDLGKNRTTVCKAVAGKPAARISWTPGGDCVTEKKPWDNDTVTVQSTCHWAEGDVSAVSCSIFHLTGNKSLSIELSQELKKREVTLVVGEDEMQPYASYTGKNNPLYDTTSRVKIP